MKKKPIVHSVSVNGMMKDQLLQALFITFFVTIVVLYPPWFQIILGYSFFQFDSAV
ncbi:hypothetical protein ACYSNO_06520 [Enterococcus sp. LJL98]